MMNYSLFRNFFGAALAAFGAALPAVSSAQTTYTIIDLNSGAAYASIGSAINASGQVAGSVTSAATYNSNAARWTGTTVEQVSIAGKPPSYGLGINASGQIAGYYYAFNGSAFVNHAFRVTGSTFTDLGTLGGRQSGGYAINASGQIAGWSSVTGDAVIRAVRWTGANAEPLDTLGGPNNYGKAINASGQIAGQCMTPDQSAYHAVIWTGTTLTELGGLGGNGSEAHAINDSGQAAGLAYLAGDTVARAVRWTGTTPTDLGSMGGKYALGEAINNSGVVVGYYLLPGGSTQAFITSGDTMIDLNTLLPPGSGWVLSDARAINDSGWITGQGNINGAAHAYLLKPNPVTVTGKIELEGVPDLTRISPAAPLGTFHIGFRTPNTTNEIYGADAALTTTRGSSLGSYAVPNIPPGVYDVAIKGVKNLRVVLPNVAVNGTAPLPDVVLPAGDANNDNFCDSSDFGALIGAYNTIASVVDGGYDVTADFNFDGFLDSSDLTLLISEYNNVGAL